MPPLLHTNDRSDYESDETIARVYLLHNERPPRRRPAVRGEMQPKSLTLIESAGEEIK